MAAFTPGTSRFVDLSHELYDGMAPYPVIRIRQGASFPVRAFAEVPV